MTQINNNSEYEETDSILPESVPTPTPKRTIKRNYRMVGETTPADEEPTRPTSTGAKVASCVMAALAILSVGVFCVAGLGAAVFFTPLLAGAFCMK